MSPDKGVVVDGQEYRLSPQDIDLDGAGEGCLRFKVPELSGSYGFLKWGIPNSWLVSWKIP